MILWFDINSFDIIEDMALSTNRDLLIPNAFKSSGPPSSRYIIYRFLTIVETSQYPITKPLSDRREKV
jgi:hypothetical protein